MVSRDFALVQYTEFTTDLNLVYQQNEIDEKQGEALSLNAAFIYDINKMRFPQETCNARRYHG